MGKVKLQLTNDRFQQPGSLTPSNERPNRLQDSTEFMDKTPPRMFAGGVCIPFLSKPTIQRSEYSMWRTGKVRTDSSKAAPTMDNRGRYFECGMEVKNIKFSEREAKSFDYGANEAARTFYCTPKRLDCPAMNRVLDNLHDVPGETIQDRVVMGKVAGANWSTVPRMIEQPAPTAHIGPGHYDIHSFESKYGPLSSNMLLFSVESGRGFADPSDKSSTQRRKERNERILRETYPEKFQDVTFSDDILRATSISTLNPAGGQFTQGDRWNDPQARQEKYVKTIGLKLPLDYDPHLDRKKLPMTFTQTPQRPEAPDLPSKDTDYTVDFGSKISMGTKAKTSPIKYSMAFKSKAPVGMEIPVPVSGVHGGPGAFPNAFPSLTNVNRPDHNSYAFLSVLGPGMFPDVEPTDGMRQKIQKFSETNIKGPVFPKSATGLDARKIRAEQQLKSVYPKFAEKLWPKPKQVEKVDPFKHLKPLLK